MNVRELLKLIKQRKLKPDHEVLIRRNDGGLAYLDFEEPIDGDELEGLVFQHEESAAIEQIDETLERIDSIVHDLKGLGSKLKSLRR